jgi:hypothetical protein
MLTKCPAAFADEAACQTACQAITPEATKTCRVNHCGFQTTPDTMPPYGPDDHCGHATGVGMCM